MPYILILILFIFSLPVNANVQWSDVQRVYKKISDANHFKYRQQLKLVNYLSYTDEQGKPQKAYGPNAMSMPCCIYITKSMLMHLQNDDEIANLLGHEIAHFRLVHLGSTHANEYSADKQGSDYMMKAGYNKCKGIQQIKRFNDPVSPTHPASIDRVHKLNCK